MNRVVLFPVRSAADLLFTSLIAGSDLEGSDLFPLKKGPAPTVERYTQTLSAPIFIVPRSDGAWLVIFALNSPLMLSAPLSIVSPSDGAWSLVSL